MRVNDKLTPRARPVGLEIGAHFVIFTVYKSKIPPEMEVAPHNTLFTLFALFILFKLLNTA